MNQILVATNNKSKLKEIRKILEPSRLKVVSLEDAGIFADPVENGSTFEENSLIKARAFKKLTHLPVAADDSGICAQGLDGLPGVHSKRFAGPNASDEDNNKYLINSLKKSGTEDFNASFVCVVAFIDTDGKEKLFKGECKGIIIEKPKGKGGFGYDPYFYIPEMGKTTAQMTENEKNSISHRGRAFKKLQTYLLNKDRT